MNRVQVETFVSKTGVVPHWQQNLESTRSMAFAEIPKRITSASMLEGMIELRIDGVLLLGRDLLGFGYVDLYWRDALAFVESLLGLKSAHWPLGGKLAHLGCERTPGTRRGEIRLEVKGHVEVAAAVHIPTLADALLDGAAEYNAWLPQAQRGGADAEVERLRALPTAWRPS